jgi:hypothetical protein
MANVPLHFSATVVDGFSVKRATDAYLNLPDSTTLAQLAAAQGTWLTDLDAVIDGAIVNSQIRVVPELPTGLKGASGATWAASRVNQTGILRFDSTGTTARWSNILPSVSNAVIVNNKIDLTNTNVAAYVTLFTTSGNHYNNPQNQQIIDLAAALVTFRKTRKQSAAGSKEV